MLVGIPQYGLDVLWVVFLKFQNYAFLSIIAKSVLNAKLCETEVDARRVSVLESGQDILIIPQATLGGKLKGKSPQYHGLISKSIGEQIFTEYVDHIKKAVESSGKGGIVESGVYGARQILSMETNGPFTHIVDI